ncbi:hypothetical protein E4T56_gene16874 [Termitomyces sp. T112]|nr:hypothetical protein E4T56_gene16874 [Termitomyces sp. T112]
MASTIVSRILVSYAWLSPLPFSGEYIYQSFMMEDSDPWHFTVIRMQGMRLMRPERAWRPIITVEIDKHSHEVIMGVDGQNPNLKQPFKLHEVQNASRIDICVWHRPQNKKKAKKRTLVASASHTLSELIRLQENEHRKEVELRLQCRSVTKGAIASRGRPQNGATILLKIRSPTRMKDELAELELTRSDDWEAASLISSAGSSTQVSEPQSMPPSPTNGAWSGGSPAHIRRRRQQRGYQIDSDEDGYIDEEYASKPPVFSDSEDNDFITFGESPLCDDNDQIRIHTQSSLSTSGPREWIQSIWPSLLPQYTEKVEVPKDMTLVERVLASFTMYNELKNARSESHYETVFARLQTEWTYVGGLLVALAAVDSAVFAIAPDSIFDVESYARSAIAASSVWSGLGIACDAWFLLRYNWGDLQTFITRALDIYSSYFFFSLSSRVPALCLFFSALTLMEFMALVAFEVWPMGVLVVCFGVGIVMTLQFLVFGAHWGVMRMKGAVQGVGKGVRWMIRTDDGQGISGKKETGEMGG